MCGIGGILLSSNSEKHINDYENQLVKILNTLKERGPDEQSIRKYAPKIGLVHTRLSIQDPSGYRSTQVHSGGTSGDFAGTLA